MGEVAGQVRLTDDDHAELAECVDGIGVYMAALVPVVVGLMERAAADREAAGLRQALDIVDDYERVLTEFDATVTAGPEHPVHARGEGAHRAAEIIHQRITEAVARIEHPEWFTGGDDE